MDTLRGGPTTAGSGQRLLAAISVGACLVFAWILFWVMVDPVAPTWLVSRQLGWALVAVLAVALWMIAVMTRPVVAWLEAHAFVRRLATSCGLLGLLALQVGLGMAVRFPPGWDAGVMEGWAFSLSRGAHFPPDFERIISLYPNNSLLLALLTRWFDLLEAGGVSGLDVGVVLLNAVVMSAAVVVAYATARRVSGPSAGYLVGLLAIPLVGVSPWIGVAYSDTLGMIFPISIVYLFVRVGAARRLASRGAYWLAIGLLGYVGYCIKPTVVFAVVAVVIGSACRSSWHDWHRATAVRRVTAGAALAAGVAAAFVTVGLATSDVSGFTDKGEAIPFTHFLMMGAQQSDGQWGGYSAEDAALSEGLPPDQRLRNGYEVYVDRVEAMGPAGYATFLHEKSSWVFGDGTFFAFGEGTMSIPPTPWTRDDGVSRSIRTWFNPNGAHFAALATTWSVVWFAILFFVVIPAFWWRRQLLTPELTAMRLSLLGLLGFLLLFEARSRYLYLYLPLFMVLAAASVTALAAVVHRASRRP